MSRDPTFPDPRQLLDAIPLGVLIVRASDTRTLYLNRALRQRHAGALPAGLQQAVRERITRPGRAQTQEPPDSPLLSALPIPHEGDTAWLITTREPGVPAARPSATAASDARGDYLAELGHELNTPINAILGFSQLLLDEASAALKPRQAGWLGSMHDAAAHLRSLCEDLLDVARIEAGRLSLRREPVDVGRLADEVLGMVRIEADHADVLLIQRPAEGPGPQVLADPVRLRQVLLNLVINAIKYNRRGGSVRLELHPGDTAVEIRVVDTGIGLDAAQLAQIFEPFNRLGRDASSVRGTGLGLALSRQLILLMKGEITVSSQAGQGTTVRLRLPALP